jgi:hypothetical protein
MTKSLNPSRKGDGEGPVPAVGHLGQGRLVPAVAGEGGGGCGGPIPAVGHLGQGRVVPAVAGEGGGGGGGPIPAVGHLWQGRGSRGLRQVCPMQQI